MNNMSSDLLDDNQAQRSYKNSLFLQSFESYISEVATSNHGMKYEEMARIVQENFQRSVLANVQFHTELAKGDEKLGDTVNASYHHAMAHVYKTFLK